ncbi:hypothetical protein HG531_012176 [Fusarium graminearum]|nr:hypothetical protein HG531_012176 [Fusarium graminearum]
METVADLTVLVNTLTVAIFLHLDAVNLPVLFGGVLPGALFAMVDSDLAVVLHAEFCSVVVAEDAVADKEPVAV